MGSITNQQPTSFRNTGASLARGSFVRSTGNGQGQAALAGDAQPVFGVLQSVGAIPTGGLGTAIMSGEAGALLETGLAPAAGDVLYLSATVAGRATTTPPAIQRIVGIVLDASSYATTGRVKAVVVLLGAGADAGASADWSLSVVRYFFLDNQAGSDANLGYIDAVADQAFTAAQTGPVALRTFEELRNRLPRYGNGRAVVVLAKPRTDHTNYLDKSGVTDNLHIDYDGYRLGSTIRASNLTNDANDKVDNAGETAFTGPNGDGSWTSAGAAAGFSITVAAGALPAQNDLAGSKLEWKGNVTAAIRTEGNVVAARSSGTVFDTGLTQTIAAGDEFFFRSPDLRVGTIVGRSGRNGQDTSSTTLPRGLQIVGFRFTSGITTRWYESVTLQFCRVDGAFSADFANGAQVTAAAGYRNDANTATINTRCGVDFRGNFNIFAYHDRWLYSAFHGSSFSMSGAQFSSFGGGCYFNVQANFRDCRDAFFGGFTGTRPAKCVGGVKIDTSTAGLPNANSDSVNFGSVDVDGAANGIVIEGINNSVVLGVVTGVCTGSALVLTDSKFARVYVHSTTTMTGTPDATLAGGVTATLASLAVSPQMDVAGNVLIGAAGTQINKTVFKFSGAHVGAVGAVVSYLADHGTLATGAIATVINYPMPACRVRNLRVKASVNPLGAALVVTIYRGGIATAVTVTITTGSTALFSDTTNEAQFAAGELLDLRLDSTGAGVATALLAAEIEVF